LPFAEDRYFFFAVFLAAFFVVAFFFVAAFLVAILILPFATIQVALQEDISPSV
jgi:hypothetical protein